MSLLMNKRGRQLGVFDELIVDNFAGGGGASIGIEMGTGRTVDIAINHDAQAIGMHMANHPYTEHHCQDVWQVDPVEVTGGRPVGLAWFSPDCKHFSKAKGGKPREQKIRDLAWVAEKWAKAVQPRIIILENVEEFSTWGPLLSDGQPCPDRKGKTFNLFIRRLERAGYEVQWRMLRACDFGAPTTRKRLFMVARCDSQPIVWPQPTHGSPKSAEVKAGTLKPWRTAAECIDWSIPCPSIFERDKPLAEATLRRIARGIQKYVIDAKEPFIVTCNHGGDEFRGQGLGELFKTITAARDAHGVVVPTLIQTSYGERQGQAPRVPGLEKPLGTVMGQGQKHALVAASLMHYRDKPGGEPRNQELTEPAGTVTAGGVCHALAVATLIKNYGGKCKPENASADLNQPTPTITAQDHNCLLGVNLVRQFGTSNGADVNEPIGTVMPEGAGKSQLIVSHLTRFRGDSLTSDVTEPVPTVVASGINIGEVRAFLMNYNGNGNSKCPSEPALTVTANDRLGIVTINSIDYVIVDIGMRMLQPHELYKAQGFPDSYNIAPVIDGKPLTKTAQVRMCGNSVSPPVAAALAGANLGVASKGRKRA